MPSFLKEPVKNEKRVHLRLNWDLTVWLYERAKKNGYGSLNQYLNYLLINFKKNKEKENKMKYG